jgi:diguanylate cyclase (GGDEF)-like protein/PAS domain S-box-containing protein
VVERTHAPRPRLGRSRRQAATIEELTGRLATLERAHESLRAVVGSAIDAIVGTDADGQVDEWNTAAERLFGWSRSDALGRPLLSLVVPPAMRAAHEHEMRAFRQGGHAPVVGRTFELSALRRDGAQVPVEMTVWMSGAVDLRRFTAVVRDVTERKRLEGELVHRALSDSLTGLANRTLFADRLDHAVARRPAPERHLAVLYLDLDDFASVNDTVGHAVADHLLVAVAARLSAATRAGDTLARLAGDEFALLAEDLTGPEEAEQIAARLLAALDAPFPMSGREIAVAASIGIAMNEPDGDVLALVRNADIAMYAAKRTPASSFALFAPEMNAAAGDRLQLKAELPGAADRCELRVHYQPLVELASGEVIGFEALARWQHPRLGLLLPADFVPLAEEVGAIRAIDRWVLAEACRQAAAWEAAAGPLMISVNLSACDLADEALLDDVRAALAANALAPHSVVLEVTESVLAADIDIAVRRLGQLRELGVRVALDEFSAGQRSLAALSRFPVDMVKIDRPLVSRVTDADSPVAAAIAEIGGALRLQTVAAGIESPAQLARLRALGCQVGQGHLFARALPATEAAALLTRRLDPRATRQCGPRGHLALPV